MCWAGLHTACHRTAAWSSSWRQATPGCHGRTANWQSYESSSSKFSTVNGSSTRRRGTRLQWCPPAAGRIVAHLLRLPGLNTITRPAVEPLPHIDALLDGTRGSCYFTKLDLASSYHQLRVRASDRWKTSFRSQLGQLEWNVVPFGLQGSSSLLNQACYEPGAYGRPRLSGGQHWQRFKSGVPRPTMGRRTVHAWVPGASGPLGRCALV
jgi:hypothetical protein